MNLRWSKVPPLEEGLYWWRENEHDEPTPWEIYSSISEVFVRGANEKRAGTFPLLSFGGKWYPEPLEKPPK